MCQMYINHALERPVIFMLGLGVGIIIGIILDVITN